MSAKCLSRPTVFKTVYPDSTLSVHKSKSIGPILNQLVQSDNYSIGLYAWILVRDGYIKDESCLSGFDT